MEELLFFSSRGPVQGVSACFMDFSKLQHKSKQFVTDTQKASNIMMCKQQCCFRIKGLVLWFFIAIEKLFFFPPLIANNCLCVDMQKCVKIIFWSHYCLHVGRNQSLFSSSQFCMFLYTKIPQKVKTQSLQFCTQSYA